MITTLKFDAEFASEVMKVIPPGYIDKTICGCGLTTVALENDVDTVIAVPTIYLAMNKSEQYPNERYNGKVLAVYGDTTMEEIKHYWEANKPRKIMVTYDSLSKVKDLLDRCKLVIDESNELLSKTKLKPEVIDNIFSIAQEYMDTVSFVSATPNPLKYMPEWVSTIDQVKIEWNKTSKSTPILYERTYPFKCLKNEIIIPLKEDGLMTVGDRIFSKIIVFINSIKQITDIVKELGLDKGECGIICGDSLTNDIKIGGLNRYVTGVLPKYLFITSSGFSGIDLVDEDAMTVVVSNVGKKWQMIDMLTDLKQAVSRQRNKNNPNYGSFIYIYNQSMFKKSEAELREELKYLYSKLCNSIKLYDIAVEGDIANGFEPYPDFKTYTLIKGNKYVINDQAFRADEYFIVETRKQYSKGFDIKGNFDSSEEVKPVIMPKDFTYKDAVCFFKYCLEKGKIDWTGCPAKKEWIELIETSYKLFEQVWQDQSYAKSMVKNYDNKMGLVRYKLDRKFTSGIRYTRKEAKIKLQEIYDLHHIERKAKHTDYDQLFKKVKHGMSGGITYIEILEK